MYHVHSSYFNKNVIIMIKDEEFAALVAKLDAALVQIEALTPKEDTTAKEDARDLSIKKGVNFLKTFLDGVLPKEKLDSFNFDELVLAAELKSQIKPSKINPAPTIGKEDTKNDGRPSYLKATVGGK
jgi:hypothetical protein